MRKNRSNIWRPIIEGELYDRAVDALQAISNDILVIGINEGIEKSVPFEKIVDLYSLSRGKAGQALFFAYYSEFQTKGKYYAEALDLLEQAVDSLSATILYPPLYCGFTGIAWVAEHIQSRLDGPNEVDLNESIDEALLELLDRPTWPGDYDLISGLVGLGVYATERVHRATAASCLERIITLLDKYAERKPEGITWYTTPELLTDSRRAQCPKGFYNLGLAHGVPGVVALLAEAYTAAVALDRTWPLLKGAVNWLLAQKITANGEQYFPAWIAPDDEPTPSRLAWCYGDLGLSAAVMGAARLTNKPAWEREALDIALRATKCSRERAKVKDAGLCHGAAGNAHIFNRFYQATGDERYKEAALFWYERTLDMRNPGEGVGGFRSLTADSETMQPVWEDDAGFLTGAAGIGLSLLAGMTNTEPGWDQVLLTSIPIR